MFSITPSEVANIISALAQPNKLFLVAIDGHGGSGKSTFAKKLMADLVSQSLKTTLVELDGFPDKTARRALASNPGVSTYYKIDSGRFESEVLKPLSNDVAAKYVAEDWWTNEIEQKTVEPFGVVIVEGCYTLNERFRNYYDYKIFIDCPLDLCLERASARDISNGGVPAIATLFWKEVYFPAEENYMQIEDPKSSADIVITSK